MHLGQSVRRVEQVRDGHSSLGVGGGHPNADVNCFGDVIASCSDVEGTADSALKLCDGGGFVPSPTVAAASGLGVEREGSWNAADGVLVAESGAEAAGLEGRRRRG